MRSVLTELVGADVGVEPTSSGNEPNDLPFVLSAIKKEKLLSFFD